MKYLILLSLVIASCGPDAEALKEEWEAEQEQSEVSTSEETEVKKSIYFQGYVQTAFEITVDDIEFRDSEDFYTRFKTDLIHPNYPGTVDQDIEVLGEYGHESFGANTAVFMAPVDNADHLFQSATDANRHFKVDVESAGNTEYRAKIILRIGLDIEGVKHCYLLHSTIDSIVLAGKPIVFDDFKTQLNAWDCKQDTPNVIEIPDAPPEPTKISNGSTKQEVIKVLGEPDSVSRNGSFEYLPSGGKCATKSTIGCSVSFDGNLMSGQSNIAVKYLELF